jgi:hypothetical protein
MQHEIHRLANVNVKKKKNVTKVHSYDCVVVKECVSELKNQKYFHLITLFRNIFIFICIGNELKLDQRMTDLKEVKSKYNGVYEYENRKFRLVKDEPLILIKKSTDNWWLCVRHNESEPFFVPSTYLLESAGIDVQQERELNDVYAVDKIMDSLNERLNLEIVMNPNKPPKVKERRLVNIDRPNDDLTIEHEKSSLPISSKQDDFDNVSREAMCFELIFDILTRTIFSKRTLREIMRA